jgi:nucleotide-binding universal stress UspA family protein
MVIVDGSKPSNAAVERTCELAKLFNSEITLIHVVTFSSSSLDMENVSSAAILDSIREEGFQILEESKKLVEKKGLKVSTILEPWVGNAGHKIARLHVNKGSTS